MTPRLASILVASTMLLGLPAPSAMSQERVRRIIQRLDRWAKGRDVGTGPEIEWQAQDGRYEPPHGRCPAPIGSTAGRRAPAP